MLKMNRVKMVVPLAPYTKKNSQNIITMGKKCPVCGKGERIIPLPSKDFKAYEKEAGRYLTPLHIDFPVEVKALFYMPTRRRVDLTNLLEAIDDIMVTYGVITDDNSKIIVSHDGSRVLYDKDFPRTEIYITRITESEE